MYINTARGSELWRNSEGCKTLGIPNNSSASLKTVLKVFVGLDYERMRASQQWLRNETVMYLVELPKVDFCWVEFVQQ